MAFVHCGLQLSSICAALREEGVRRCVESARGSTLLPALQTQRVFVAEIRRRSARTPETQQDAARGKGWDPCAAAARGGQQVR